ncbi:serine racemase VanT catalytic subunit [Fusibacter bizertensis]
MKTAKQYGGIDTFKLIAALLVVSIHTSPLWSFSQSGDFLLTRVAARIAVPFFLMVSGFFILPQYLFEKKHDVRMLMHFLKKATLLYAVAIIIYLPLNLYAGHFKGLNLWDIFRMVLFDGTFYHLWYLPASILGVLIVYLLGRFFSFKVILGITLGLYGIGLMGDSYFYMISNVPIFSSIFNAMFHVFSYTRNGLFYAPIFLTMGAWFGHADRALKINISTECFAITMILMALEGLALHHLRWQRHDSMYLLLLPCMYFLFQLVLSWDHKARPTLRIASTWIYLIHPLIIVVVRGIAKITATSDFLVENSLIHYFTVSILSVIFALLIAQIYRHKKKENFLEGRAWIELDRAALDHNVEVIRSKLPTGCQLMPAVKTNAYGHGAILIARELNHLGVSSFCVATVDEGVQLRQNGITGEILILGYTHPHSFPLLKRYHLMQTVLNYSYARMLNQYGEKFHVHVKIDTGMHRLGERSEKIEDIVNIFQCPNLKIEGVFTHLGTADEQSTMNKAFTLTQASAFLNVVKKLDQLGIQCPKRHIVSSYGLFNYPELAENYARVGIALYGMLSTRADTASYNIALKPVLAIKARIAIVKDLFQGESAGYGLQFIASKDTKIAVVTIGYGDGIPRSLSCGVGNVLINGYRAPIIGRICMDQMLVDVTDILDVNAGDIAVIIGKSGNLTITACDLAEQTGTIANEILCRLGQRLERVMI